MEQSRKKAIEEYIQNWHWDKSSAEFVFELGSYLFDFMDDLRNNSGLKENTLKKHISNCWWIGNLIGQYSLLDKFTPEIFANPPYQEIDFRRRFSDSSYMIKSYNSTCKKLKEYSIKRGDLVHKKKN